MPTSRAWVTLALVAQLLLSAGLVVTAIVSVGGAFLVEDATGNAVAGNDKTLFAVSKGESFVNLSSAGLFLAHALWALYTVNRAEVMDPVAYASLLVSGCLVTLIAIDVGAIWGSVSTTLDYLECAEGPAKLPRAIGDVALKCGSFQTPATALCVLASLIFCAQGSCTAMLYVWDADFRGPPGMSVVGSGVGGAAPSAHGSAYVGMASDGAHEHPFPPDALPGVFVNLSANVPARNPAPDNRTGVGGVGGVGGGAGAGGGGA